MIVGVVTESFPDEHRVALVPASVPSLIKSGFEVVIEAGAGLAAGYPDSQHVIRVEGPVVGGHGYLISGVNTKTRRLRMKNSWGLDWGDKGHAWIGFDDMRVLIDGKAELCLATEIPERA